MKKVLREKYKIMMFKLFNSKLFNSGLIPLFLLVPWIFISCGNGTHIVTWEIDSVDEIAGNSIEISGAPLVITSEGKEAVEFNGINDGLLIKTNPVEGWNNFLIEVDIKPYPGFPENVEQRFLHIQDPENENRRILIELRLNEYNEWYGDWFIKTENETLTLVDPTQTHPLNEWATISLEYKNGEVTGLVNGEIQAQGHIKYLSPGPGAHTSLGTRMDQRSWYKGAIKEVRFVNLD